MAVAIPIASAYDLAREMQSRKTGTLRRMSHLLLLVVLAIALPVGNGEAWAQSKKENRKGTASSLTGCLDEQEGRYVLLDERSLTLVTDLDSNGVPTEALFAKHLGHKVTVRGNSVSGGSRPLFKVRQIETVSEMCVPATQQ